MNNYNITIESSLLEKCPGLSLGVIVYKGVTVTNSPRMLIGRFRTYQEHLRLSLKIEDISQLAYISAWRDTLKKMGTDPSKYRHSAESLLRRVLQSKEITSINGAVDVNNLLSLQFRLPIGIYDLSKINGAVTYRLGEETLSYQALNGREWSTAEKPILMDSTGPFGSPITDSTRTMVQEGTSTLLQVLYIPSMNSRKIEKPCTAELINQAGDLFTQINGGDVADKFVIL